jgi:uncharacterized protein (TIGR02118 family)
MKTKLALLLIMVLTLAYGCQQNKSTSNALNKKGMFKVTILYPSGEGKTFDMDYYSKTHMPLMQTLFGKGMKGYAFDKGIASGAPDTPLPYVTIGYLYFEKVEDFQEGMKIHGEKILADIPKYTNIKPVVQISEVIE